MGRRWTTSRIAGIEALDFTGSGNNTLTLRAGDVLDLSDTPNANFTAASSHNSIVALGDLGDQLNLIGFDPDGAGGNPPVSSWALQSSDVNLGGSASGIYDIYDLVQGTTHIASVAVHHDVTVDASQHAAFLV